MPNNNLYSFKNKLNLQFQVFLSSPQLDAKRLMDIIELYLKYRSKGDLTAIYVEQNCDKASDKSILDVKREVTKRFDDKAMTFVQYKILRKILHPSTKTCATFIAGVSDGKAEVLITSGNFHASSFTSDTSEMMVFLKMDEKTFQQQYLELLAAPNATVSY